MKRILLNISILLGLVVVSCDNPDLSQEQNAKNDNSLMQRQSSMFSYIESTQINNGVDCENNILIFPTWEKYWETIEVLDQIWLTIKNNSVYALHKQGQILVVNPDFYDNQQ